MNLICYSWVLMLWYDLTWSTNNYNLIQSELNLKFWSDPIRSEFKSDQIGLQVQITFFPTRTTWNPIKLTRTWICPPLIPFDSWPSNHCVFRNFLKIMDCVTLVITLLGKILCCMVEQTIYIHRLEVNLNKLRDANKVSMALITML